jgi:hypothetical protein
MGEDVDGIFILFGVIASFVILYYILSYVIKFILVKLGLRNTRLIPSISSILILGCFVVFLFSRYGVLMSEHLDKPDYEINGLKGKVLILAPDSLQVFKSERVIVRIAKLDLRKDVFLERKDKMRYGRLITDTLRLSTAMKVNLKESSHEEKLKIKMLNNNAVQVIDTTKYTEWVFEITPIKYGYINLIVSISSMVRTEFGIQEIDCPIYEKKIEIFASQGDKIVVFWNQYSWISILLIVLVFLIIYKLIPNQSIIEYHMPNSKKTNFWNAGALGLVVYIVTILSIVVFKTIGISMYFVPLVFIGTILIYAVFTAVSLRDNDKLSEENFLKLMGLAIKKIPPLNLIFKSTKDKE